jgi:[ribosomal protein S5]-alanine N-acetyltransferase
MLNCVPDLHFTTDRLSLRPVEPADVCALHAHWLHPEVRRYLWDGVTIPREQVEEIVRRSKALFHAEGFGLWSLRIRTTFEFAGCGGYWYFRDPPERELILSLSPEWWGKGLATEAGHALLAHAFESLHFDEVQGSTDAPNSASVRLMEHLGLRFRRRGALHGLDTVVYALSQTEWAGALPGRG